MCASILNWMWPNPTQERERILRQRRTRRVNTTINNSTNPGKTKIQMIDHDSAAKELIVHLVELKNSIRDNPNEWKNDEGLSLGLQQLEKPFLERLVLDREYYESLNTRIDNVINMFLHMTADSVTQITETHLKPGHTEKGPIVHLASCLNRIQNQVDAMYRNEEKKFDKEKKRKFKNEGAAKKKMEEEVKTLEARILNKSISGRLINFVKKSMTPEELQQAVEEAKQKIVDMDAENKAARDERAATHNLAQALKKDVVHNKLKTVQAKLHIYYDANLRFSEALSPGFLTKYRRELLGGALLLTALGWAVCAQDGLVQDAVQGAVQQVQAI